MTPQGNSFISKLRCIRSIAASVYSVHANIPENSLRREDGGGGTVGGWNVGRVVDCCCVVVVSGAEVVGVTHGGSSSVTNVHNYT